MFPCQLLVDAHAHTRAHGCKKPEEYISRVASFFPFLSFASTFSQPFLSAKKKTKLGREEKEMSSTRNVYCLWEREEIERGREREKGEQGKTV